jgi:hypothetical protein
MKTMFVQNIIWQRQPPKDLHDRPHYKNLTSLLPFSLWKKKDHR